MPDVNLSKLRLLMSQACQYIYSFRNTSVGTFVYSVAYSPDCFPVMSAVVGSCCPRRFHPNVRRCTEINYGVDMSTVCGVLTTKIHQLEHHLYLRGMRLSLMPHLAHHVFPSVHFFKLEPRHSRLSKLDANCQHMKGSSLLYLESSTFFLSPQSVHPRFCTPQLEDERPRCYID